jgi:HlyD family secretion protein
MKKTILISILLLVAVSLMSCSAPAPSPTPQAQPTLSAVKASGKIVAEGKVVPAQNASLGFQIGGVVAQVPVAVGSQVKAGQVLAQLDSKNLELSLAQADANLAVAQARLNQAKRGPTADDLAAAQQAIKSAQAAYDKLLKPDPDDLAAAQQAVKSAQAAYDKLLKPDPNDLAAAKADLDKAQAAIKTAQAAYDAVGGDGNPYAGMLPQRLALQNAYLDLQKAQTAYNRVVTPSDVQVQQALSALQTAKNQLTKLNPSDAQIQQALSALQTAKDQLTKLNPFAEDIAAAEASVKAAQVTRDIAADQLTRVKLVAPFDGTIASVDIKPGEQANVGASIIRLADLSNMQVETTDLTELNVVNVQVGDSATVTFDAVSGLELTGKIASIKGFGDNKQGDIVYTLVINLDKQDPRLRWNMTAKVSINK